jgi:polar amino acid transport system ATP-binding protein
MNLKLQSLCKRHVNVPLFENINLSSSAQVLGLIGSSGSGKSSLLRLIAGLDTPSSGQIFVDNMRVPSAEGRALEEYRKSLGVVFQSWNLFPHLSAKDNIVLPLTVLHAMTKERAFEVTNELLCRFDLLKHKDKKPGQLSGGQNQRVAILRAIAHKPKLLLLDEPTSALDPVMTSEVLDLLVELKMKGCAFIIASHHIPFLKMVADEIVFMNEGKVIEQGTSEKLFTKPSSSVVKEYLTTLLKYQ